MQHRPGQVGVVWLAPRDLVVVGTVGVGWRWGWRRSEGDGDAGMMTTTPPSTAPPQHDTPRAPTHTCHPTPAPPSPPHASTPRPKASCKSHPTPSACRSKGDKEEVYEGSFVCMCVLCSGVCQSAFGGRGWIVSGRHDAAGAGGVRAVVASHAPPPPRSPGTEERAPTPIACPA